MTKTLHFCATLIAMTSLTGCVTSVDGVRQKSASIVAVSGERTKAGGAEDVNRDCTLARIPNVRVMEQPKHGSVELAKEGIYPHFTSGIFVKCNAVKVMGIRGYYTSNPSYVGADTFRIRTSYGSGNFVEDAVISVNVVK